MAEHKHAAVLRAIAAGEAPGEFEARCLRWLSGEYEPLGHWTGLVMTDPDGWIVRRKPQYIMVNGFKVPKPLMSLPELCENVFVPDPAHSRWYRELGSWDNMKRAQERGVAHDNPNGAIAHAKAMLGIDPQWDK